MATKRLKIILILITVIFSFIFISCSEPKQDDTKTESKYHDSLIVELEGSDSLTVLEILKLNHSVATKSTAMGEFVTGIDSTQIGDGYFWVYTVNDTTAKIACDLMRVNKTDRIKWYFRK